MEVNTTTELNFTLMKVVTLYDYTPEAPDELGFTKGEILCVIDKQEDGWWKGYPVNEPYEIGVFPFNYVRQIPIRKAQERSKSMHGKKSPVNNGDQYIDVNKTNSTSIAMESTSSSLYDKDSIQMNGTSGFKQKAQENLYESVLPANQTWNNAYSEVSDDLEFNDVQTNSRPQENNEISYRKSESIILEKNASQNEAATCISKAYRLYKARRCWKNMVKEKRRLHLEKIESDMRARNVAELRLHQRRNKAGRTIQRWVQMNSARVKLQRNEAARRIQRCVREMLAMIRWRAIVKKEMESRKRKQIKETLKTLQSKKKVKDVEMEVRSAKERVMRPEALEMVKKLVKEQLNEQLHKQDMKMAELQQLVTHMQSVLMKQQELIQNSQALLTEFERRERKRVAIARTKEAENNDTKSTNKQKQNNEKTHQHSPDNKQSNPQSSLPVLPISNMKPNPTTNRSSIGKGTTGIDTTNSHTNISSQLPRLPAPDYSTNRFGFQYK